MEPVKAPKSVRFSQELESTPGGRLQHQNEALAEILVPRLTSALQAHIRVIFAEELALWAGQMPLLRQHLRTSCNGGAHPGQRSASLRPLPERCSQTSTRSAWTPRPSSTFGENTVQKRRTSETSSDPGAPVDQYPSLGCSDDLSIGGFEPPRPPRRWRPCRSRSFPGPGHALGNARHRSSGVLALDSEGSDDTPQPSSLTFLAREKAPKQSVADLPSGNKLKGVDSSIHSDGSYRTKASSSSKASPEVFHRHTEPWAFVSQQRKIRKKAVGKQRTQCSLADMEKVVFNDLFQGEMLPEQRPSGRRVSSDGRGLPGRGGQNGVRVSISRQWANLSGFFAKKCAVEGVQAGDAREHDADSLEAGKKEQSSLADIVPTGQHEAEEDTDGGRNSDSSSLRSGLSRHSTKEEELVDCGPSLPTGGDSTKSSKVVTPSHTFRSGGWSRQETPGRRKAMSCTDLRQGHEKELCKEVLEGSGVEDLDEAGLEEEEVGFLDTLLTRVPKKVLRILPRVCGLEPWWSGHIFPGIVYQWILFLLAVASAVEFAWELRARLQEDSDTDRARAAVLGYVLDVILSIGTVWVLVASGTLYKCQVFPGVSMLLSSYTRRTGFSDVTDRASVSDLACTFVLWGAAIGFKAISQSVTPAQLAAFVVCSTVHVGITSFVLHTCRCLTQMVDGFCEGLVDRSGTEQATHNWNLFQAVCRTTCSSLQLVFSIQQVTATAAALLCIFEVKSGVGLHKILAVAAELLLILSILRTSVWSAAISDKCARVPMLVNSLPLRSSTRRQRMYIVEYIVHSRAGFYIFDVRITSASVVKAFYIACAVTLGLASQML